MGMSKVISMSKIKKISLIMKKWILKGQWLEDIGSNPHSKGDVFSRSLVVFFEIKKLISIMVVAIVINKNIMIISWVIIYTKDKLDFLIGN